MANKGEMVVAYKAYRQEDKRTMVCDHCKKKGHIKDKCWILHPHLKPSKWKEPRANYSNDATEVHNQTGSSARPFDGEGSALAASSQFVRRSDLDALIKALKDSSGISLHALNKHKSLIVDSGASHHMISDKNLINNIEPALGHVVIANGEKVPIKGIGDLRLFDKESKCFYMPTFTSNLLSVKKATTDLNCYAIFGPNDVLFQDIDTSKVLGQGVTQGDLYVLEDLKPATSLSCYFNATSNSSSNALWHARLGH